MTPFSHFQSCPGSLSSSLGSYSTVQYEHPSLHHMNNEMVPNEAAITLPLCLFSIVAASSQLDKINRDFIREQCGKALSASKLLHGPEGNADFQAFCELAGATPIDIGTQIHQRYVSTFSRPPPQSALSECDKNDEEHLHRDERHAEHAEARKQERISRATAEAKRREQEQMAGEKADADRIEQERIAKEKAEAKEKAKAARLERERRRREELAAAKAAAENQYCDVEIEKRIRASTELLEKRLEEGELDEVGPKFHPIEVDLPEAHNETMVDILFNEEGHDAEECIVQLGEACSNVLKVLHPKRVIIGQVRDSAIDKIKEDSPDIDEGAGMGAMLTVLESKDGQNDDDSITNAAKECIALAVDNKVLEKKGASPCNWFVHHSALGHEYKASFAKCIGFFSLMTVAVNVLLVDVVDSDAMSDAKVLAEGHGYTSLDGWTLGQFTFLIAARSLLGGIETEMELAMTVICEGFVGLLSENIVEIWRQYGDKIILPDEDGVIGFSDNAPDFFSDARKGTGRRTGVVLNFLAVFQSPIITLLYEKDVGNLDGKKLALALLRCPTSDIIAKTKLLKRGDLFFSKTRKAVADAKKFVSTHLNILLKKSKGRAGIYLKYCIFLDLRRDINQQLELLLKVLNRSDLEIDLLQRFFRQDFD